jgi:hypothetical protein
MAKNFVSFSYNLTKRFFLGLFSIIERENTRSETIKRNRDIERARLQKIKNEGYAYEQGCIQARQDIAQEFRDNRRIEYQDRQAQRDFENYWSISGKRKKSSDIF